MYWKSLKLKVFVATHLDSSPVLRPGQRLSWCPRQYRWRCRPARTKSGPWDQTNSDSFASSPGAPAVPGVQLNWFLPGERPRCTCRTSGNHSSIFIIFQDISSLAMKIQMISGRRTQRRSWIRDQHPPALAKIAAALWASKEYRRLKLMRSATLLYLDGSRWIWIMYDHALWIWDNGTSIR